MPLRAEGAHQPSNPRKYPSIATGQSFGNNPRAITHHGLICTFSAWFLGGMIYLGLRFASP
jgi:hypothetical protein